MATARGDLAKACEAFDVVYKLHDKQVNKKTKK